MARDHLLTDIEAAEMLGINVKTVRNWRYSKLVPLKFVRIGRAIRYRESDLLEFIEARVEC